MSYEAGMTASGKRGGLFGRLRGRAAEPAPALELPQAPPGRWVEFCAVTERGPSRPSHEDALVVGGVALFAAGARVAGWLPLGDAPLLFAAVDGMGGYAGGAQAAAVAASALAAEGANVSGAVWARFFEGLSSRVAQAGEAWGTPQMGATAAALRLTAARAESVNVGDCRVHRARGGYVGQLSVDDRLPGSVAGGVTQSLGGHARGLDPHRLEEPLGQGPERFMLCTDGLFGALDHAALRTPLIEAPSAAQACAALAAAAWAAQATDNFSVIVADVSAPGAPPPPTPPGPRLGKG
jgi:serine/threonine protein phosphatase PrpC